MTKNLLVALSCMLAIISGYAQVAVAIPAVTSGTDDQSGDTQTNAAFTTWASTLTNVVVDDIDDLTGTSGANGNLTSTAGNNFTSQEDGIFLFNGTPPLDNTLQLIFSVSETPGTFVWNLAKPSNAFGFFGWDNDGGTVSISFVDGAVQNYSLVAEAGSDDNLFWGISGLSSLVSSVTISTTDPPGTSYWYRFAYGESQQAPPPTVPLPGSIALIGIGLACLGWSKRMHEKT